MHPALKSSFRLLVDRRLYVLAALHATVFAVGYWVAFALRFDFRPPRTMVAIFWQTLAFVVAVKLPIFYTWGNYHGWLRHATFSDLVALLRAVAISFLVVATVNHFLLQPQIPRIVLILDSLLAILLLGGLRSLNRLFYEGLWAPLAWSVLDRNAPRRRVLIVTHGLSGENLARQLHAEPHLHYRVVGFLSDDGSQRGSRLGGIPVLGTHEDLVSVAEATRASDVFVIAGALSGKQLRAVLEECQRRELPLHMIPGIDNLLSSGHKLLLRDVDINDLLHRDPVQLDCGALEKLIEGQTVLVTGAGGSIGSEICRQLLRFRPGEVILVGRGENRIFAIERELSAVGSFTALRPVIADVTDQDRMRRVFERYRPQLIFHAAAHKHVPLMESNVGEAVKNNVLGTKTLADLAHEFRADGFVLISTDKAVNPTSVMGVTKQLAERCIHALSKVSATRFVAVRFGNVLGSAGSVVPIFQEQIRKGGPLTITDPRMVRYFMTIPEASQLVIQAAAMGKGGEIFVLDMGAPVKIVDLARDLIRLSGLREQEIEIVYTGIRPGEKLYEELYFDNEQALPTAHPKLRAAYHRPYDDAIADCDAATFSALASLPEPSLRDQLRELAPDYRGASDDAAGSSESRDRRESRELSCARQATDLP